MTDQELAALKFFLTLPRIDVMDKEAGDVNVWPREALRLADSGLQLFRCELDRDTIIPDHGMLGPSSFVIVRGSSDAEVARLLRQAQGIVYERDH